MSQIQVIKRVLQLGKSFRGDMGINLRRFWDQCDRATSGCKETNGKIQVANPVAPK